MKNLARFAGEQADKATVYRDRAVDLMNKGQRDETSVMLAELHLAMGELAIALVKDLMGKGVD